MERELLQSGDDNAGEGRITFCAFDVTRNVYFDRKMLKTK